MIINGITSYTSNRQVQSFGKKKTISDISKTDEQNFIKFAEHLYDTATTEFENRVCRSSIA
jgi:hypothetical protein